MRIVSLFVRLSAEHGLAELGQHGTEPVFDHDLIRKSMTNVNTFY